MSSVLDVKKKKEIVFHYSKLKTWMKTKGLPLK